MNVSGSSRKGRDSLSPQLVEYLRYSLWIYITPELFREQCMDIIIRKTVPISDCTVEEWILLVVNGWCRNVMPGSILFESVQSCTSVLVACWWLPNRSGFYEITPGEQYDDVMQVAPSLVPRAWPQHWKFCDICSLWIVLPGIVQIQVFMLSCSMTVFHADT